MIQIKSRFSDGVLFESSSNTMREAVVEAVKFGIKLSCANLSCANLSCADFYGANLSCANLSCADFYGADLGGTKLSGADLEGADLTDADLNGADLRGANLRSADLIGANLRSANLNDDTIMPDGRKWSEYRKDHLAGLCQTPEIRAKAIAAWGGHSWGDCPMHAAHDVRGATSIEMGCWVALYDALLLERPEFYRGEGDVDVED